MRRGAAMAARAAEGDGPAVAGREGGAEGIGDYLDTKLAQVVF